MTRLSLFVQTLHEALTPANLYLHGQCLRPDRRDARVGETLNS